MRPRRIIRAPKAPIFVGCEGLSEVGYARWIGNLIRDRELPFHLDDGRVELPLFAILEDEDVRVVDGHAMVAVDPHDLVQAFFAGEADQLQAAAVEGTVLGAKELQVHQNFAGKQPLERLDLLDVTRGFEAALEVGETTIDFHRHQRRVVPRVFEQRAVA